MIPRWMDAALSAVGRAHCTADYFFPVWDKTMNGIRTADVNVALSWAERYGATHGAAGGHARVLAGEVQRLRQMLPTAFNRLDELGQIGERHAREAAQRLLDAGVGGFADPADLKLVCELILAPVPKWEVAGESDPPGGPLGPYSNLVTDPPPSLEGIEAAEVEIRNQNWAK